MNIDQLETPVAIVDLDKLEANIAGLQAYLSKYDIAAPSLQTADKSRRLHNTA